MGSIEKSEIKPSVIQFVEIRGINREGEELEPEEYANRIKDITSLYDETVRLYEGHIDKHEGKIFMATFGVPVSHEEDPERAIKSTLLLKKKIAEYNKKNDTALTIKAGINVGKVYAGSVGSEIKKEYTVMGDAVNIAARIMEYADDGQILVSEEIHRITKPAFQFAEMMEFQPRGYDKKINLFPVLNQQAGFVRRRGIEGLKSPLVGRTEIFNVLKEFLDKLLKGSKNTVVITGEAGVGKSRLIEELFTHSLSISLERAKVINWCSGCCSPYKEAIYLPFIEIIKQICGIDSKDSEKSITEKLLKTIDNLAGERADEIYPYIANIFNIRLDSRDETKIKYLEPQVLQLQTHLAVATLLQNFALKAPCVYIIDDLYLADMATLEAIKFFLETNKDIPMLVFLITRTDKNKPFWKILEELRDNQTIHEINVQRLSRNDTRKISENLLRTPGLPASLLNEVIKKADGNPFFLEEIIKLLIAEGILFKKEGKWCAAESNVDFHIPYTIEAVIRNRFDTLSGELKTVLEEMSVIGRNFSKKILSAFSVHWETIDELIKKTKELDFVSTSNDEDFFFNHALVREIIYGGIPDKRKRNLHLKIAETIETLYKDRLPEFFEILFEHYSQAGDYEKTIEYGTKAAENARKRYANHEAILFYLAVLKELNNFRDNEDRKREILKNLGEIHALIGQNEDAFEFFNQALKYCDNPKTEAKIHTSIADVYENISEYDKAIESYNKAMNLLDDDSITERAAIETGIARIHYERGDYMKCCRLLEKALTLLGDSATVEIRKIQARIYNRFGSAYYALGEKQKSFEHYKKALKLYEIIEDRHGQGAIYNNLCDYYTSLGDYQSALEYLRKSLEIDIATGNLLGQVIVYYNTGDTYYQIGDFEMAEQNYFQSMEIAKKINNNLGVGYNSWGLGLLAMEKDDLKKAEQYYNTALSLFNKIGSKMWQIAVMTSIAELYLYQKEFEKAWQLSENTMLIAKKIKDYDMMNEVKITQAKIRLAQAAGNKKLAVTYLQDAKTLLNELNDTIDKYGASLETKFQVYFHLCRIHYQLGMPKETMKFHKDAVAVKEKMMEFMEGDEAKRKLLNRRLYREFENFCKEIKVS